MRTVFLLFLIFISDFAFAQPSREEIKKHKIKKWTAKTKGDSTTVVRTIWYDRQGNDSIVDNSYESVILKNSYQKGKLVKAVEINAEGKEGDIYDYEFKPDGSYKETFTDADFKMKSYEWYDAKGKLLRSQSPDGNTTTYKYDAKGKLLTVISDGKNDGVKINNKYSYNAKGQLIKLERNTDGTKSTTTYQYDNNGRLTKQVDKGGWEGEDAETETVFEYNDKRLVSKLTVKSKGSADPGSGNIVEYEYEYYK